MLLDFHSFTWQVVWQHKPSGYSLTGKIPYTWSDNISHCVHSTALLFTPTEQSYPAFLSQIPPFSPWEEISFPFLWALRWCHPQPVSIAPNNPVLSSVLPLAATHYCFTKKKKKKERGRRRGGWPLAPETWLVETTLSDNTTHRCGSREVWVWFGLFADKSGDVLKIKPSCAKAMPLCLTWTS